MQTHQQRSSIVAEQNQLVVALVAFLIWMLITFGGGWLATGGQGSLNDLVTKQIGFQFVLAPLFLLAVVFSFRWQRPVGIKPAEPARSWLLVWLPVLFIVGFLGLAAVVSFPPTTLVLFVLVNTLLVGVSEELMFRGLIFYGALSRLKIWPAIVITAALFGLIHAFNGFITGDFGAAFIQACSAAMSGIWLHAIRLRTRSLYPAMLIHGLWDFAVFIFGAAAGSRAAQSIAAVPQSRLFQTMLFSLPLALYGLWLLRNIGKQSKDDVLA